MSISTDGGTGTDGDGDAQTRDCPDCGERTPNRIESVDGGAALVTICERCGAETARYD